MTACGLAQLGSPCRGARGTSQAPNKNGSDMTKAVDLLTIAEASQDLKHCICQGSQGRGGGERWKMEHRVLPPAA